MNDTTASFQAYPPPLPPPTFTNEQWRAATAVPVAAPEFLPTGFYMAATFPRHKNTYKFLHSTILFEFLVANAEGKSRFQVPWLDLKNVLKNYSVTRHVEIDTAFPRTMSLDVAPREPVREVAFQSRLNLDAVTMAVYRNATAIPALVVPPQLVTQPDVLAAIDTFVLLTRAMRQKDGVVVLDDAPLDLALLDAYVDRLVGGVKGDPALELATGELHDIVAVLRTPGISPQQISDAITRLRERAKALHEVYLLPESMDEDSSEEEFMDY
jgi:hypothetical protein